MQRAAAETSETGYGRYTDIYERPNGRWLCVAAPFMRLCDRAQGVSQRSESPSETTGVLAQTFWIFWGFGGRLSFIAARAINSPARRTKTLLS
jgi:hypothetical protein